MDEPETPRRPWHLWPGSRGWPSSAAEERRFVADLAASTSTGQPADDYTRGELTMLVTALRCGATVADVSAWAPGLRLHRLLAAYHDVAERLADATASWEALVDSPDMDGLAHHGPAAAKLLPAAIGRLVRAAVATSGAALPLATAKTARRIREVGEQVASTERRLSACTSQDRARRIGSLLFDPDRTGLWHDPLFIPTRVGQVCPERLDSLVSEMSDDDDRFNGWTEQFTGDS